MKRSLWCLLAFLCCGVEGWGACSNTSLGNGVTCIQSANSVGFGSPQTVAFGSNNTAGKNIIVGVESAGTSLTITCSDTNGNTYTRDISTSNAGGWTDAILHTFSIASGANTVSCTTGAVPTRIVVAEIDVITAVDVSAGATGNAATADSTSASTTNAVDLIIGWGFTTGTISSVGSGFTALDAPDTLAQLEAKTVASTGSYNATLNLSGAADYTMQMIAFKASGGGSTPTCKRKRLGVGC